MMLSESMQAELKYAFAMILYGFLLSFCYHMLLFFRIIFYHRKEVVDAEDILFLSTAGFFFFLVAYEKNYGILRWYAFVGFFIGIYFYVNSFGKVLEVVRKLLLKKLGKPFKMNITSQVWKSQKRNKKGQVSESESCDSKRKSKKKKWA